MNSSAEQIAPSLWATRLAACAIAVGAIGSLTACDAAPAPPTGVVSPSPSEARPQDGLPRGVCVPFPFKNEELERKAAERCIPAMEAGSVALVAFGDISKETTDIMAAGMQTTVLKATKGLIHVTVSVTRATPKAEQALDASLKDKNCIDSTDSDQYASNAADLTMPELHDKNFVIAATTLPACAKNVGGVADGSGSRHADVFGIPSKTPDEDTSEATHELLHLYQLGHGGRFWGRTVDGSHSDLGGNGYELGKPFDLKAYLATAYYEEYGGALDGDVMGDMSSTDFVVPNPVHIAKLEWPQVAIQGEQVSLARQVGADWTSFDKQAAQAGKFAAIKLSEPIGHASLGGDGGSSSQSAFDMLEVVPRIDDSGEVYGVELFVSDAQNNTASLGELMPASGKKTATTKVTYGGQQLEIQIDGKTAKVRQLTPAVA